MPDTLHLGRIAGIRIGLNWSWLVVLGLVVWSLAAGVFPAEDPGLSNGAYVGMGIAAALLFFASLLLHELGHAVVARREGVEIDGITLWLFGGVARFKGAFPSPGSELRIALAGPAVSACLGGAFLGAALLLRGSTPLETVAAWLGYINLLLLGFNLLPALPLDGGRVLHSALWRARGDLVSATRAAAAAGRGFGYAMVLAGIVALFLFGAFGGAWLALLGLFLVMAAGAEARYVALRESLRNSTVAALMVRTPVTVRPSQTLQGVLNETVATAEHSAYPVVDRGRPVGLLLLPAVLGLTPNERETTLVEQRMLPGARVPTLTEDASALEALTTMTEARCRGAFVVRDGQLVGFLSASDLTRAARRRAANQAGARVGPWSREVRR